MSLQDIILFKNDLPDDLIIDGDLAIDTEAMGLNNKRDRLCLIQISNNQGKIYLVQFEKGAHSAPNLKKLLTNPKTQKILHFARFDMAILYEYLDIMIENVFCTKIASRLVRTYTDSHGLKDLCRELLSVQLSKQQQSSDWGAANLTKEQQLYAASDVIYLHAIRDRLESLLIREERKDLAQECFKFLSNRILLDLSGWNEVDIFAH